MANEEFNVDGLELAETEEKVKRIKKSDIKKLDPNKMYIIVIEEEEGALNYVPVGVDGKVWQIMRGVEVEVPYSVLHVLENSKATRLVKEFEPDGKTANYVPREYGTIPFRVLRAK